MKLTIQATDLLRFRRLASTLMAGPRGYFLNLTEYRDGLALALDGGVWAIVMPIRGRRPAKPFRIPLAAIWHLPATISGKVVVQVEQQKGFGKILWYEDGWDETAPFPFGPGNFDVQGLPPEPSESQNCPASLLGKLAKCSRICQKAWPSNLAYIRITPDGEIGATDGKRLLLLETEHRFPWPEPVLVRATELFRQPEFQKSFDMGVRDAWVRFDFGDCVFFTRPEMERFPDLRKVLPTDDEVRTRLIVAPKDATFLKKHLRGRKTTEITLFCSYDKTVSIHRPEQPTLIAINSHFEGDAMVLQTGQGHLIDAISNGCLEFRFGEPYPAAFGPGKTYCWVPTEMSILPLESEFPAKPTAVLSSGE